MASPSPQRPLSSPSLAHICWSTVHHLAVGMSMKWPDTRDVLFFILLILQELLFFRQLLCTSFGEGNSVGSFFHSRQFYVYFYSPCIPMKQHLIKQGTKSRKVIDTGAYLSHSLYTRVPATRLFQQQADMYSFLVFGFSICMRQY